jgi:hypothetical protein
LSFPWHPDSFSDVSMKFLVTFAALALATHLSAVEVPKIFAGLFEPGIPVKGQIGVVMPPPEIDKHIAKVEAAARKDPKWFREFAASAKPGAPLPYEERLGLTKAEYEDYLALWAKREFKATEGVTLLLRQTAGDTWSISGTGGASTFSTLRYSPKDDNFSSPNGPMKRLEDVKADSGSILGEWTGCEWRFEEETGIGKTKENFAIGRLGDKKYGILVYRAQEFTSEGTRLLDKSLVVRFALGKAGQVPAGTPPTGKPAPRK